MSLHELCSSMDLILQIAPFLPLQSIAMMERTSRQFLDFLREKYLDKIIYRREISKLFNLPIVKEFDNYLLDDATNCRELLRGFYECPLEISSIVDSCVLRYNDAAGPVDFSQAKPCQLLKTILKYYRGEESAVKVRSWIHKFVLMASVSNWNVGAGSVFRIAKTNLAHEQFNSKFYGYSNYSQHSFSYESYPIGKGLVMMLNDFPEHKSQFLLSLLVNQHNNIGPKFVIYTNLIRQAEPIEGGYDIQDVQAPPYGFSFDPTESLRQIRTYLYHDHDGSCESYNWEEYLQLDDNETWSEYFLPGMEWWGCYGLTTYDYLLERFIIATASRTD